MKQSQSRKRLLRLPAAGRSLALLAIKNMSLKSEIIYYSKLCYENKFVCATDGNVSVKKRRNLILATAADTCKGEVKNSDIIKVDSKGKKIQASKKTSKKPSTELKLHLFIYDKRKDVIRNKSKIITLDDSDNDSTQNNRGKKRGATVSKTAGNGILFMNSIFHGK